MALQFRERTSGEEARGRFTTDSGVSEATYVFYNDTEGSEPPTEEQLREKIAELLGATLQFPDGPPSGPGGPGSINRLLPLADPKFPCNFVDEVDVLAPPGEAYISAENTDDLAGPVIPGHARYRGWELQVKFTARPYALFENDRMTLNYINFYDVDGSLKTLWYYKEWLRYCHPLGQVLGTRVSATAKSAMRFRAPGTANVDNVPFDAIPEMALPDTEIILRWYGVPARYVTHASSFLGRFVGYINQAPFALDSQTVWAPGQLLYMGAKTIRAYNQPSPFLPTIIGPDRILGPDGAVIVPNEFAALTGTFAGNALVDLDLRFILTNRTADVVTPTDQTPNGNWIPFGHNLLPHFLSKKFYYATADATATTGYVPSYLSVPFEILFCDPDFAGTVT